MKTLHRHISEDYLVTFVMTLLVFTFVMCIGILFKASDFLARGVPWGPVLRMMLIGLPAQLSYSIPISVMTSSLLVFGRLSSDGEITAMRACGISMWTIASRPLMFALLFSVICLYINSDLSPRSHLALGILKSEIGVESPLEMLPEGRFIHDFSGYTIYLGSKKEDGIEDIRILDSSTDVKTEIVAQSGVVGPDETGVHLVLTLHNARVDPIPGGNNEAGYCESYEVIITNAVQQVRYDKREGDFMTGEMAARINNVGTFYPDLSLSKRQHKRMALKVEFNKRLVLGVSCFVFMLLGIPLGVRSHRSESSIGIAMGLILFFAYYMFIMLAEELVGRPQFRPDLFIWMPVLISMLLGVRLIRRVS